MIPDEVWSLADPIYRYYSIDYVPHAGLHIPLTILLPCGAFSSEHPHPHKGARVQTHIHAEHTAGGEKGCTPSTREVPSWGEERGWRQLCHGEEASSLWAPRPLPKDREDRDTGLMRRATPKCPGLCLGQGHPWAPGENKVCVPHLPPCLSVTRRRCPQCGKAAGQKASAYPPVMWVHRQGDTKSPTTGRRVCHPGAVCGPSVLSVPAKCFPLPRGSFEQPGAWGPRDPGHAERGRALEPLPRDQRHPCRRFKVLIPKWGSHCPGWSKRPRE